MKKLFILITALMAIAAPKAAQALDVEGVYAGALGGINFLDYKHHHKSKNFQVGWTAGGFAGYRFCNGFRAEGEAVYRHNNGKKHFGGHVRTWSLMANGLYDFDVDCWCLVPYLGAGLGYDWTKAHVCSSSAERNGFAWQLIGGFLYPIDDCMEMGLEYRYHQNQNKNRLQNNTIDLRVQWYF